MIAIITKNDILNYIFEMIFFKRYVYCLFSMFLVMILFKIFGLCLKNMTAKFFLPANSSYVKRRGYKLHGC